MFDTMLNNETLIQLEEILFLVAVVSYLVSSGSYIWYLIARSRLAATMGPVILYAGFLAHTVSLLLRWGTSGHAPMSNLYESLSLFSWGIVLFFLIAQRFYPVQAAGALVVPAAFIINGIAAVTYSGPQPLSAPLQSIWLVIHVSISMLSYGLFALAFGAGFFYVVQEFLLKKNYRGVRQAFIVLLGALGLILGLWFGSWWAEPVRVLDQLNKTVSMDYSAGDAARIIGSGAAGLLLGLAGGYFLGALAGRQSFSRHLPSLDVLDEVSYRGIAFGFPLLTIGIIAGAIWADAAWGRWWGWDAKETWSFITWIFYGAYLHTRLTLGWRGRHSAYLAIGGMAVVMFTYLGVNLLLPGLHGYN